jgi:hypothetical protein
MLARTPEDRRLAHLCNKLDETVIRLEHLEGMIAKLLPAPPPPARKAAPAASADSA